MAFDGRLFGGISVLAAVVETGNFVRAAEALGLTQSGISRAVARLEARVGVRLLDRTPRGSFLLMGLVGIIIASIMLAAGIAMIANAF
jgi:hypothetical protein